MVVRSEQIRHSAGTVVLSGSPPGGRAIRYLWYEAPCTQQPYKCAVYAEVAALGPESGEMDWLPLGPFIQSFEHARVLYTAE